MSMTEVIHFNALKRLLSGISGAILSDRLLDLERKGLISKKIYAEIPPRVEHRLTVQARELEVILRELGKWVDRWKRPEIQIVRSN
jgi:DNA-binding HxlR family transcriptional regulator